MGVQGQLRNRLCFKSTGRKVIIKRINKEWVILGSLLVGKRKEEERERHRATYSP